jgi:uncharacterized protein
MRNGFQVFDTHAHIGRARHSGRRCTADQMLASMDQLGIDRALLIPYPVVEDHRQEHDEIAAAVRAHPNRFVGAACLYPFMPLQDFQTEVRRCAEELGFRAIKLQPKFQALNIVSERSDFFFEAAVKHDLTVVAHTGDGLPLSAPSLFIMPARKFPEVRIVLGHAGGSIFFQEAIVAASVCPNIWVELSTLMPHHMLDVIKQVGAPRLMIGTDVPESAAIELDKIIHADLPAPDKREILWESPARLFGSGR